MLKISMANRFQFRIMTEFSGLFGMRRKGEIHYIGGAEILPAPFTSEEEKKVIEKLGSSQDQESISLTVRVTPGRGKFSASLMSETFTRTPRRSSSSMVSR